MKQLPHEQALQAAAQALRREGGSPPALGAERCVSAYLRAMREAGWKLAPLEPTPMMEQEGQQALGLSQEPGVAKFLSRDEIGDIWNAMLNMAPDRTSLPTREPGT